MEQIRGQEGLGQFAEAFASVKRAKNFFWWILLLSLLVQLAGFALARFTNYISPCPMTLTPAKSVDLAGEPKSDASRWGTAATTLPTTLPAAQAVVTTAPTVVERLAPIATAPTPQERPWYHVFRYALPATMFLSVIVGMLLILTLTWMVKLALLARVAGIEGYMRAFFWSLIFWVLVIPWQHVMRANMLVGATFSLEELLLRTDDIVCNNSGGMLGQAFYYTRFVAYPLIAVLVLLITQGKFGEGYRLMVYSASTNASQPTTPKL